MIFGRINPLKAKARKRCRGETNQAGQRGRVVLVPRLSLVRLRVGWMKRTAGSAGSRASSSEPNRGQVGPPPWRIPSFIRAERVSRWVSLVFLRESEASSVEAVFGQLLKVSVPAYQSAEGVKTPWVGSWQGSGTPCPAWARFLATEWRRDLVVLRAMECRKAQEGFSVNRWLCLRAVGWCESV